MLLNNGKFAPFDLVVSLAREGIKSGAFNAKPAQLHFNLDLAMRDVDRVLAEAVKADSEKVGAGETATGPFGTIYPGFTNNPEAAIDHLLSVKDGEVADAYLHPELGAIAFVYGNEKMGLRHILEKRGREFVSRIPEMLRTGRVEKDDGGLPRAYVIDSHDPAHVAVIRLDWDGKQKAWLVTAYDDIDGKFAGGSKLSDTATAVASEVPSEDGFVFSQEPGTPNIADQQNKGKIKDFGEKLGGARKDQAALRDAVTRELSDEEIASQPLSKIWPKESIDQIEDTFIAAVAHAARAEIPAKPRKSYLVSGWVNKVKALRGILSSVIANKDGQNEGRDLLKNWRVFPHFYSKVQLLEAIGRENWNRIGKVEVWPEATDYVDGEIRKRPLVIVEIDGNRHRYERSNVADVVETVQYTFGDTPQAKKMDFEVRGSPGRYAINKKGDPLYRKLKTFETSGEALAFRAGHYDELVAAWEAVKDSDNVKESDVRRSENRPRTAQDWRNGKDVTPEQFQDAFQFRGIEFGNWVSQGKNAKERQGMLNAAYDALMDLASIIGVPSKAMSLNGTLGLGFGSRGSGKFAAHFEPDMLVINLTKTRGAGSLAHEWFHALDNYFQSQRGKGYDYITNNPENYYVHKQSGTKLPARAFGKMIDGERDPKYGLISQRFRDRSQWELKEGVRTEVAEAFADLVLALNDSPMAKRASLIDKGRSGGYWSRIIERGARSFENYVIHKMMLKGYHNDYLANVTSIEEFSRDPGHYPYLLEGEIQPVAEAFDNLFATIQTKETDKGVAMFSRQSGIGSPSHRAAVEKIAQPLLEGLARAPGLVVVQHSNELPFDAPGDAKGALWRGDIYLVADNLATPVDVREAVAHELLGHFGLRGFFGDKLDVALNEIHKNNLRVQIAAKKWKDGNADLIAKLKAEHEFTDEDVRYRSIEEALSGIAEKGEKLTGWKRLAATLQSLLRSIGLHKWANALEAKTDAEALLALKKAEMFVRRGWTAGTPIPDAAYPLFMTAYHGSPHDHDGFDSSKIGTGEGAQAYGWGHYFSSVRAIAEWYRRNIRHSDKFMLDGVAITPNTVGIPPLAKYELLLSESVSMGAT